MEKVNQQGKPPKTSKEWELRLYVAGQTPKSLTAFANLKKICEEHLAGEYHIEVIDLLKNPQLASGDSQILGTWSSAALLFKITLVRKWWPHTRVRHYYSSSALLCSILLCSLALAFIYYCSHTQFLALALINF